MKNERIEGTILIDITPAGKPHMSGGQVFAGCTIPDVRDLLVTYAGEIAYAMTGEPGERIWWFAGQGQFRESWSGAENAKAVGWS